MGLANEILEKLIEKRGREIDLNNKRDRFLFFSAVQREIEKRDIIIQNIHNVLKGESTYDKTQYKTILDRNRAK